MVLGIVADRRFTNFRPVLDVYVEKHFNSREAAGFLIRSLRKLLGDPGSLASAKNLRSAIKVWEYLFKLLIQSRILARSDEKPEDRKKNDPREERFKNDLLALATTLTFSWPRMRRPISSSCRKRSRCSNSLPTFNDLGKVFSATDIAKFAVNFGDAATFSRNRMIGYKMTYVLAAVRSSLFEHAGARKLLLKACLQWLDTEIQPWGFATSKKMPPGDSEPWREALKSSVALIQELLERMQYILAAAGEDGVKQEADNLRAILGFAS